MPRFVDGAIDIQELLRRLTAQVVNAMMDAEADQPCGGRGEQPQRLPGARPRHPRWHADAAYPEAPHRQLLPGRRDRALPARGPRPCCRRRRDVRHRHEQQPQAQRVAEKMGVSRLSKDQVSTIASSLDAGVEELCARPLDGSPAPCVWLDATYVKCRRGGCVPSTSCATACARPAPGGSGAAWAGSSRRCSAGATPPPSSRCTTRRATCWRSAARGPRRCWRRRRPTPLPTSTSRRHAESACEPTMSRSGPTEK